MCVYVGVAFVGTGNAEFCATLLLFFLFICAHLFSAPLQMFQETLPVVHGQVAEEKDLTVKVKHEVPFFLSELKGRNLPEKLCRYVGTLPSWIFDSGFVAEKKGVHSGSASHTSKKRFVVASVKGETCALCKTYTGVTAALILRQ